MAVDQDLERQTGVIQPLDLIDEDGVFPRYQPVEEGGIGSIRSLARPEQDDHFMKR